MRVDSKVPLLEAASAFRQQDFERAESVVRKIIECEPNNGAALELLGNCLWRQNCFDEACVFLDKACIASPHSATAWYSNGTAKLYRLQYAEGVKALSKAVKLNPSYTAVLFKLAKAHYLLGNLEEARELYKKAGSSEGMDEVKRALEDVKQAAEAFRTGKVHEMSREIVVFERREFLPYLLNACCLCDQGLEIGVKEGGFSEHLLRHWKGKRLLSVDPWREFAPEAYDDIANVRQEEHDRYYKQTIKRMMSFESRSVIWRLTSHEAVDLVPDESLDFCYIDGDHSYAGVKQDIEDWYPKIRSGGILSGHDYLPDATYHFGTFGVRRAVKEFAESKKLNVFITQEPDTPFWSWILLKR